jgi:type II secretory pathway component PulF
MVLLSRVRYIEIVGAAKMIEAIIAIVSILIGFALSEASTWWRTRRQSLAIRVAIIGEMNFNRGLANHTLSTLHDLGAPLDKWQMLQLMHRVPPK